MKLKLRSSGQINFQMTETNKRNPANGFDEQSLSERMQRIIKYSVPWKRVKQRTVAMTTLIQTLKNVSSGKECSISHICPWERSSWLYYLVKFKSHPTLMYGKNQWEINIKHTDPSQPKLRCRLFCNYCQYVFPPKLIDQCRMTLESY